MKKIIYLFSIFVLVLTTPGLISASYHEAGEENTSTQTSETESDYSTEVTAQELGSTETEINTATEEETEEVTETGMLIEIGNTTAEETTVVVRTTDEQGTTEDVTLEIETEETDIENNDGQDSDLNDWIAGDQLTFVAEEGGASGSLQAIRVRNHVIRKTDVGRNGWITAIRASENEVDVLWGKDTYTLNLDGAKMVAGLKNPATISDLKVGDRVRARVYEDNDGNKLTWNTKILVVLRRGNSLFMRVTRWVVPARITYIPENPTVPTTITVEILPSKFYEKSDVNNLVGEPGDSLEVNVTESTILRRQFFGKAEIREFSEGDRVQIIGRINETTGQLDAKIIHNASIQKLNVGRHIGVVTAVDITAKQLTVTDVKTGLIWRIDAASTTKIYKGEEEIAFEAIQVGDRIRVRGVASRTTPVVTAETIVVLGTRPEVVNKMIKGLKEKRQKNASTTATTTQ